MRTAVLICILLMVASCGKKIEFYGDTVEVDYPEQIDTLHGSALVLEGVYTGFLSAHDGMLMLISRKHPDGYIYLYDAETGKRINAICKKGDGPDEVLSISFYECFERDSSGIAMWVNDVSKGNLMLVNTQGEYLKRIKTSTLKSNDPFFGRVFVLNDSLLVAYAQAVTIFENKVIAPRHRIFNYKTGEKIKEYKFYSDYHVAVNGNTDIVDYHLLSYEALKPDKSKIAMVMSCLNRVNLFDLASGKIKSIITKDSPDLNVAISSEPTVKDYYVFAHCDDHYIYAIEERASDESDRKINVFDWDGNFVRILQIDGEATDFAFDAVRKIFYTKNDVEEITRYDLNFLYP